jgi:TIR domain
MSAVFISYRRENTAGEARALFNDLAARLGDGSVFMDVDSIALGRDFRVVLEETTATCDLMLVLIGRNWVEAKDEGGRTRLENPGDYVRLEIEAALKRNIPVTPVLVQGAHMPVAEQLPETIRDFAYRNGFELSNTRWESDIREMIRRLGLDGPPVPPVRPKTNRRIAWVLISGLIIAAMAGGSLLYPHRDQPDTTVKNTADSHAKGAPDGYVALGAFDGYAKTYANFGLVSGKPDESGVKSGDIMRANLPVTLRSNLENTQSGNNPSKGEIAQGDCVRILDRHDNVRGQTWAGIKREKCG